MRFDFLGMQPADVAEILATVDLRITVEDFAPKTGPRHADAIVHSGDRSEIAHDRDDLRAVLRLSHKAQHTLLGVAPVDPLESCRAAVELMQRLFSAVRLIQVGRSEERRVGTECRCRWCKSYMRL